MKKLAALVLIFISVTSFAQTIETEVIKQINGLRLQMGGPEKGLSPFVRNAALDSAAMYHAKWMVATGVNSHIETQSAPGIKALAEPWDRAAKYGVTAYAENCIQYCMYTKNGGAINPKSTATAVFQAWKKSQAHYEVMLYSMPKIVEARIGIAIVEYNKDEFCIVMVVGANVDHNGNLIK
jgi:uncharacterized protein YkwD